MMKMANSTKAMLLVLSLNVSATYAFSITPRLEVNGFGTAGASMTNATLVDAYNPITKVKNPTVPVIGGVGQSPTFTQNTYGGLRFRADVADDISFTAQFLSEGSERYVVQTDWLYAQWQINDAWEMKVGRIRLPLYMLSQYIKIGYVYPWSRPPLEVYNFLGLTDFQGVLFQNTMPVWGDWVSYASVGYGNSREFDSEFTGAELSFKNIVTLEWIFSNEILRLRAGYLLGGMTIGYPESVRNLQQLLLNPCAAFSSALSPELVAITNPGGLAPGQCLMTTATGIPPIPVGLNIATPDPATAQLLTAKNVSSDFLSFGYDFHWNHLLSMAEWYVSNTDDDFIPSSVAWYVLGGITWDNFTFHATYSTYNTRNNANRRVTNTISNTYINPFSALGPALPIPVQQTMQGSVNQLLSLIDVSESTIDLGVRWDVLTGTALKFDYRYVTAERGTHGFFTASNGVQPVFPGKRISWVTAVIDVVF